ncbi:autotransporter assembly complex protein TamA [Alteromonas facilis]|uniref:autotransporter assembly complex protein TamA n=1 Tax=Alteromonas facilis TaxID=2048004 RepID=UPI000F5C8D79|nr:autotransporter assembly complex family protein [Alteromonas facilis]
MQKFSYCLLGFVSLYSAAIGAFEFTLNGVDNKQIKDNVKLHLNTLDIDTSISPDRLWQEPIIKAVNKAVRPFGYYDADMRVLEESGQVEINISLGAPLIIEHITLEVIGGGRSDDWFSQRFKQFPLKVGDVLLQHKYDQFKADMLATAISRGYFDFKWQAARLDLVREEQQANILLVAQSGERYRYGDIRIKGDAIAQDIIARINPLREGAYYLAEEIGELNRVVNDTGYFNRAVARPLVSEAVDHVVPIEVTLAHKPRDLYDVGLGFSSDIGAQLSAKWHRPWVNSRGHSVQSELFLSSPEQSLSTSYRIPMGDVKNDYLSIQAGLESVDENDTRSDNTSLSVQRFWKPKNSEWQQSVFVRYQLEKFAQGSDDKRTTQLVLPGYSISLFRSRGGLDISWGNRTLLTIEGGTQSLLSDIDIARVSAKTKWIRTFEKHRLVARAELGAIETSDFDQVPASMRFFAGGDQSIRGFNYQTISPRDEDGDLLGAQYLAVGSVEYAYPILEQWRLATFIDAGTATNDFEDDIAWGAGIGVHYLSVIGPIRLYLARGKFNDESNFQIHFSIGPEL